MTNNELRDRVLDVLAGLPARSRSMFGGYGLYLGDKYFGLIADEKLYLRTDEDSRGDYLAHGMMAFQPRHRPRGPKTVGRNFEVPRAIRDDPDQLRAWALRAASTVE